jgi:hypothetical protein
VAPAAVLAALVGLVGVILCVVAAKEVPLAQIGDAGLGSVLDWRFWFGFCLMQFAFFATLGSRRPPSWLLALLTAGLVVAIYGAAAFAVATPRGEVTWRHIGIIDHLTHVGGIDTRIDAYFGWPGFFALFAVLREATGLSLTGVALWAPVWNNVLWLLAVGALVTQFITSRRHVWLTIWLFASVNWIDQDYFSPQAFAFLLYLVVLALMLRLLGHDPPVPLPRRLHALWARMPWPGRSTGPIPGSSVAARRADPSRAWALVLVIVLSAAMIASHQLTPFALLMAVVALALVGRTSVPRLPVILVLLLAAWLILPASAYLDGHPVAASAGDLTAVADTNLVHRISGSDERLIVLRLRMIVTAAVWVLAALGLVRRWRAGHRDVACVALAAAPFVLLPAQTYGGEMLLRVTLFSLPFMAFLAAAALMPPARPVLPPPAGARVADHARWVRTALAALLCVALGAASLSARYGNARFDMFTPGDMAGVRALYAQARPGDVLLTGAHPTPWRYRDYDAHRYLTLQDLCWAPDITDRACFDLVRDAVARSPSGRGLVLINRANREAIRMLSLLPAGVLGGVETRLGTGPEGRLVLQTPDAQLYELRVDRSRQ